MSEIEKQFFEVFNIPKKLDCKRCGAANFALGQCAEVNCERVYPQITDRILLELICILNKHYSEHYQIASMIVGKNIEEVKKSILNDCIEQSKHKDFKHQVQTLFKDAN